MLYKHVLQPVLDSKRTMIEIVSVRATKRKVYEFVFAGIGPMMNIPNGSICEFLASKVDGSPDPNKFNMTFVKKRPDKQTANSTKVLTNVLSTVKDNITEEALVTNLVLPNYGNRVSTYNEARVHHVLRKHNLFQLGSSTTYKVTTDPSAVDASRLVVNPLTGSPEHPPSTPEYAMADDVYHVNSD